MPKRISRNISFKIREWVSLFSIEYLFKSYRIESLDIMLKSAVSKEKCAVSKEKSAVSKEKCAVSKEKSAVSKEKCAVSKALYIILI